MRGNGAKFLKFLREFPGGIWTGMDFESEGR